MAAVVIIRAAQRSRITGKIAHEAKVKNPISFCDEEVVKAAIERNRRLPKVAGWLMLVAKSQGLFGGGADATKNCWFELDPADATLGYWSTYEARFGSPKQQFALQHLQLVDTNEHHRRIFLTFKGQTKALHLMVSSQEEYGCWMDAFESYGSNSMVVEDDGVDPAAGAEVFFDSMDCAEMNMIMAEHRQRSRQTSGYSNGNSGSPSLNSCISGPTSPGRSRGGLASREGSPVYAGTQSLPVSRERGPAFTSIATNSTPITAMVRPGRGRSGSKRIGSAEGRSMKATLEAIRQEQEQEERDLIPIPQVDSNSLILETDGDDTVPIDSLRLCQLQQQ